MCSNPVCTAPLTRRLVGASRQGWSGQLMVLLGRTQYGIVVLHRGRVAWAVCKSQRENLGTFLRRLGRVTRAQLQAVQVEYDRHQGRRKFGALLEEAGAIRRPVLRRCLLLHTRFAMEGMLAVAEPDIAAHPCELTVDVEMTFSLEELMPDVVHPVDASGASDVTTWNPNNRPLRPLRDITGYRAAALISADGEVTSAHATDESFDPAVFGVYLAAVLESSSRAVGTTHLGAVDFVLLACTEGALVARWLDEGRRHLVAVLIDEAGQLGGAKHRMKSVLPELMAELAKRRGDAAASPQTTAPPP